MIEHDLLEFTVPELTGDEAVATVMWGDGMSEPYEKGLTHEYPAAATYSVKIIGKGITGYSLATLEGVKSIDLTEF